MLLVVILALALALLAGTILWAVKGNQHSDYNVTLSTYKEVLSLSAPTDHIFLENLCISAPEAPNSPPFSTQVQLVTMKCNAAIILSSSMITGVLLQGLQSGSQLVDHDLVFYWRKDTHIKLNTSLITLNESGLVTIYVLTDRRAAYLCSVDHVIPKNKFYVRKWPVKFNLGNPEQCILFHDTKDFFCEFNYEVPQSSTYFLCFYRTKYVNENPRRFTYTYNMNMDLMLYNTSLADSVRVCNLNHSTASCCASYGGKFTGLWQERCHFIKTDVSNNDNDLGIDFTVTVSPYKRLCVTWLFLGLLILVVITAVVLSVLCVATLRKGRNENVRDCCISCHLYGQNAILYQHIPD